MVSQLYVRIIWEPAFHLLKLHGKPEKIVKHELPAGSLDVFRCQRMVHHVKGIPERFQAALFPYRILQNFALQLQELFQPRPEIFIFEPADLRIDPDDLIFKKDRELYSCVSNRDTILRVFTDLTCDDHILF